MGFLTWLFGPKKNVEVKTVAVRDIADSPERQRVETVKAEGVFSDVFIFEARNQDSRELSECKVGDFVKFWCDSETERIRVFRRGSVGGSGRIGDVPREYYDIIFDHLQQKLEFETELLDITTGKIKCRLVSKEETETNWSKMVTASSDRISTEVRKKYTRKPKDNFYDRH